MKVLLIPTHFYDIGDLVKALRDDVEPVIYDFYAPFPTIHQKVMRFLRHAVDVTEVGIVMPKDAEDKCMKLFHRDVALSVGKPKQWEHFGVLASSIQAVTGLDKLYVLNSIMDTFEFAGVQRDLRAAHEVSVINAFDFQELKAVSAHDLFFTDAFEKYCRTDEIVPKLPVVKAAKEEIALKIRNLTGTTGVTLVTLKHSTFGLIWAKLKEVMSLKELASDAAIVDTYFEAPSFETLGLLAKAVLRLMFAIKRDSYDTAIGTAGLTFAGCVELLLLPVLGLDLVFAEAFYGFVFGKDDELKARLLKYIETLELTEPVPEPEEAEEATAEDEEPGAAPGTADAPEPVTDAVAEPDETTDETEA